MVRWQSGQVDMGLRKICTVISNTSGKTHLPDNSHCLHHVHVPTTHHFFIIVITPQGSSLTHLHLIVQTLSPITFIMRLLFSFSFSFLRHLKTSMLVVQLNYLTCTTGSKALMHLTRPRCVMQIEVF